MILRDYQTELIRKVASEFKKGKHRVLTVLPCGGGKTCIFAYMAANSQKLGKTVWFLVHRRELIDQTVQTFRKFDIPLNTIHIGMVGTYARHLDEHPAPDFIVFDEAHFSAANTWQKIINKFPDVPIAGLTATPCRLDGRALGNIYDSMVEGVSVKYLIEKKHLSPYRYYAPSVTDLSQLKKRGNDYDTEQAAEILTTNAVFGDVIAHYKRLANGKKAICYCSNIKHSKTMAQAFCNAGINAVHFDGDTPAKERKEIIRRFREGKIQILCNVDLISCGFDCPDCECCILLRPTMSTALYIQQAMRCMRYAEGKTAIILDHVNNFERHGLPDDDREWDLNGRLKQRKEYDTDGKLTVRQCDKCYGAYNGKLNQCPYCGAKAVLTQREIKNIREIRLEEVKESRRQKAETAVASVETLSDCRNIYELFALAKKKGYKPQWAYIQAKKRGWLK